MIRPKPKPLTRRERRAAVYGPKPLPVAIPEPILFGPSVDPLPGETILDDDYQVHCGYIYIADGRIIDSDISGTVRDLRRMTGAAEIRRCEIVKRGIQCIVS